MGDELSVVSCQWFERVALDRIERPMLTAYTLHYDADGVQQSRKRSTEQLDGMQRNPLSWGNVMWHIHD